MPKKIQNTTKAHLVSVPLPNHGTTYTVISHQFVIDYAFQALATAGFGIVDEEYRCTADGQIAQGIYRLNFNNDPELSMMFAWTNSYNKQVKFKCVVGAYINQSGSVMISGDIGSWVRKHTGSADTEVKDTIDQYISNAHMYYNQLCSDKVAMEVVSLNKRKQSQLLGVLFAEYEILTTEQASMIREQMKKPQQVFANTDSLWAFYNFVTNSLQHSHPKTWMEDQRILHYFIGTICDFSAPPQSVSAPPINLSAPVEDPLYEDPNQTNILDQIAEVTEQALKDELIFGVSGVAVSAEGLRNVPIDEVLEKMQESDNQVVQEEVETEEVLHQSKQIIPIDDESYLEVIVEQVPFKNDEVITYTDPAGNTFEAPVIPDPNDTGADDEDIPQVPGPEPENDAFEYSADDFSLSASPADYEMLEAIESTEGAPAVADLDSIPVEKKDDLDFELNLTDDETEDDGNNIPDFF